MSLVTTYNLLLTFLQSEFVPLSAYYNMICRSLGYVLQKQSVNKANKSPYFRNHTQITILGFVSQKGARVLMNE